MELDELKQAVYATDPAAVLVAPRILRRLLQEEFKVPHLLVQAPHESCYFFDRQVLFRHVEQDELNLDPDRLLPPTVILLTRPTMEQLQTRERDDLLLKYWRLLFHAHVHLALHRRQQEGHLTPAVVRARIGQIGPTEFEEIRTVLQQENYLLAPQDDVSVYIEFASVYLELRYFRSNLRATYFPALHDFQAIDQMLALDVDADALFTRTRLAGAPNPVVRTDTSSDESHDYYWKLLRHAERSNHEGDMVRAAIVRTKAARVAPVALTRHTRAQALEDLEVLTRHLQEALKLPAEEAQEWLQVLPALLDKADQGNWPVEAKLLYDLQKVCTEHQRKLYALDVVEWALSAGRRPIKRPLSSLQMVRITKHLRSAAQRLTMARVSDEDRQRLAKLLQTAQHRAEERLRERFRPILQGAFYDVGLTASSPPEQVALQKMIEDLLDRITENGFITFSDLRDTLSRNQLKLPDLADPHAFWRGDPLLRLDRRLATLMEGVYQHGPFYLRWLESCSSLFFGTILGRFLTRNLVLPFGGALVLVKGLEILVGGHSPKPAAERVIVEGAGTTENLVHAVASTFGFMGSSLGEGPWLAAAQLSGSPASVLAKAASTNPSSLPWYTWFLHQFIPPYPWYIPLLLGVFLLCLIHFRGLRDFLADAGTRSYRFLRLVCYEAPARIWQQPLVQQLLSSWPALLLYWYGLRPPVVAGVVWWYWPESHSTWALAALTLFVTALVLNSRFGYAISEALMEAVVLVYSWLRFDVLQGLFRQIYHFFKQVMVTVESILYTVDEWLRFRSDENEFTLLIRAVLGVLWFPVSYLIRVCFITLIEPSINPLKLPLSILAAKFMLLMPWYAGMLWPPFGGWSHTQQAVIDWLTLHAGESLAWLVTLTIIVPILYFLPSAVAFFLWEMQENWRLFRANRSARLRPVVIGRQGETMRQLLKPGFHAGFHSGTIPRLFAQLRRAERDAYRTGIWRSARTYRQALREVARSVQLFVERELLVLLQQSKSWANQPVRVGQIVLSCNRVRIELMHADYPTEAVWLAFEERSGWQLGSLEEVGWLKHLTVDQRQVMSSALTGLYKIAGIDFVREQLTALLSPAIPSYELTDHHLVIWTERNGDAVRYDLRDRQEKLRPQSRNGHKAGTVPTLDARRLFFSRVPLTWEQWVDCWQKDHAGQGPPRLGSNSMPLFVLETPAEQ